MLTRERDTACSAWMVVRHSEIKDEVCDDPTLCYDPYKLHISIHRENAVSSDIHDALVRVLDAALFRKLIVSYKFIPPDELHRYQVRNASLPYVIYLHSTYDKSNVDALSLLCKEIENLLKGVKPADKAMLHGSDLLVSEHVTFRQCARNGEKEYIPSSDDKFAALLKQQGSNSQYYKHLHRYMKMESDKQKAARGTRWQRFCQFFASCCSSSKATAPRVTKKVETIPLVAPSVLRGNSNSDAMRDVGGLVVFHYNDTDDQSSTTSIASSAVSSTVSSAVAKPDEVVVSFCREFKQ